MMTAVPLVVPLTGGVQALVAVHLELLAGGVGPALVRLTSAVVQLHLRTVRGRRVRHVHAPTGLTANDLLAAPGVGGAEGVRRGGDVGLDGVLGGVRGEAVGDGAFEEVADAAGAVVTAGAQQDGAVHLHRRVPVGQRAGEGGGQAAAVGVAVLEGEVAGAVVLLPAVTNGKCTPELFGSLFDPVLVWYIPFSRSASTHGPVPTHGLFAQSRTSTRYPTRSRSWWHCRCRCASSRRCRSRSSNTG